MITLRARANGSGRLVDWARFKKGELVTCNRWNFLITTVLTDVVTDVIDLAKEMDPACAIISLIPNGFTTASFDISLKGRGFQVNCGRRLVRGWFPLNPIAAEFGRNYDVLLTITADTRETEKRIAEQVQRKYACEIDIDSEQPAGADPARRWAAQL